MNQTINPPEFSMDVNTQALLGAAVQAWENTDVSEPYVQQALAQPNIELDVLVSAYRYYFYKHMDAKALQVATQILNRIQSIQQWPTTWEGLKPILLAQLEDPIVRLYLSTYTASGLVLARLGRMADAWIITDQVRQIEAKEFGADVLLNILKSSPEEED